MTTKSLKEKIWDIMLLNTKGSEPYFPALGWFLIVSYIGFYFFNKFIINAGGYENLALRITISLLGLMFLLYRHWPAFLKYISPILFYVTLLLSFPFFFVYMLLYNQESIVWHVNGLAGFVLLAFFVDWVSFFGLSIVGVGLAMLLKDNLILDSGLISLFTSYIFFIVYFLILSKKNKYLQNMVREMNEKLESKVQERTIELNKALEVKTLLLNNISHEIRTPIQGFTVLSEGLVKHWNDFDEGKKINLMLQVSSNAKRLANLINNLLDLSKFSADKMIMNFEVIDLNNCIKSTIEEYEEVFINNTFIKIVFNKCETESFAEIDEERIKQVVRNFISNAIKFNSGNSVIIISLNSFDEFSFHFKIKDNGVGIPDDELNTIFDEFIQSSRTKTAAGGTGLGLSICKKIIEAHQGRIWASSNDGEEGATFHFIIPNRQSYV